MLDHLITRYASAEYLTEFRQQIDIVGKQGLDQWQQILELTTSTQRQKFLQAILDNPKFVQSLNPLQVFRLQQLFLAGNDEKALDIWPLWHHVRSDEVEVRFTPQPEAANAHLFVLVQSIAAPIFPGGITYLRDRSVPRPDGSCCLIAAYAAAYGGVMENNLDEYRSWLDERLTDSQLGGDRRVGWLIARSLAEGLRGNQRGDFRISNLAGWPWLEEALKAAESEEVKLQVAKHQLARLLDAKEKRRVQNKIRDFKQQFTSAEAQSLISQWHAELTKLGIGEVVAQPLTASERAQYLELLKARASQAESRGDAEALGRYRALITKLETDSPKN